MISKYEKTPYFNTFLMSLQIFKKIQNDPKVFNNWKLVSESMRKQDPCEDYLTTGEALSLINSSLDVENNLTLHDLKFLIKKEIIFSNIIQNGKDSKGRAKVNYQIPKVEVENYIALMELFQLSTEYKYIKKDNHPKTGEDIIIYQTILNDKNGVSKPETKLDAVFKLLQKEEFQTFLGELLKMSKA